MDTGQLRSEQLDLVNRTIEEITASGATVRDLEAMIASKQEEMEQTLKAALDVLPEELRVQLLSHLYWLCDEDFKPAKVAAVLGVHRASLRHILKQAHAAIMCIRCGTECTITINSKAHLANINARLSGKPFVVGCADEELMCQTCRPIYLEEKRQQQEASYAYSRQIQQDYHAEVERLRTMPYAEYLKTDHWQECRATMLRKAKYRCQVCNRDNVTLHVHHRTYERRGNEPDSDLIVLCAGCHKTFHDNGRVAS